jgi:hypothetical protein
MPDWSSMMTALLESLAGGCTPAPTPTPPREKGAEMGVMDEGGKPVSGCEARQPLNFMTYLSRHWLAGPTGMAPGEAAEDAAPARPP